MPSGGLTRWRRAVTAAADESAPRTMPSRVGVSCCAKEGAGLETAEAPTDTAEAPTGTAADPSETTRTSAAANAAELRSEAAKVLGSKLAQVFLELVGTHLRFGLHLKIRWHADRLLPLLREDPAFQERFIGEDVGFEP